MVGEEMMASRSVEEIREGMNGPGMRRGEREDAEKKAMVEPSGRSTNIKTTTEETTTTATTKTNSSDRIVPRLGPQWSQGGGTFEPPENTPQEANVEFASFAQNGPNSTTMKSGESVDIFSLRSQKMESMLGNHQQGQGHLHHSHGHGHPHGPGHGHGHGHSHAHAHAHAHSHGHNHGHPHAHSHGHPHSHSHSHPHPYPHGHPLHKPPGSSGHLDRKFPPTMPADHGPSRMSYSSPSGPTNPNTAPTPVNATASATAASTAGANGDQEKGDHPAFVVGPGGTFDKNKTRYVKRDLMALRTQSTEPPSDLISFKPIELLDAGPSQMRDESQRTPGKLIGRGRGRGLGRKLSDLNESSIGSPPVGRYGGRRWNSNDDERGRGRSGLSSAFEGRGVDRSPSWGSSGGLGSSMKPGGVGPTRINTLSKPKEGGEWERGMKPSVARNKADDLWDDVARVGTSKDASMDLADMAEAAARFRLEMNELMNADELKGSANAEDSKPEDIDELNKMTFDLEITPAHDSRGKSPIISNEDVLRGLNKMDEPRKSSLDTTIHAKQTPERATVASTSSSSPSISIPASSSPLRNVISSSHAEIESLSLNGRGGGLSSANDISRPATALVTLEEDEHRHGGREMLHQMNRVSMPNAENLFDFPPGISIQDTLPDPREPKTKVWYYMDPQKQIQGPFNSSRMRQWFEGRYFNVHLPLRLGNKGDFVSLGELFPNPDTAFRHIPPGLLSQYCRNNSARFRDDGSSLFSKPSVDQRFGDLGDQHGVQPSGASISGSSTKMHMGSSSVAPSSVHMMQSFSMSSENRSSLGVSAMDNRSFVDPDISDSLASKRASEPSSDYRRILYGEQNSVETHRGAQESRFLNMERTLGGESHRAGLSIPREETELSRQSFGSPMPMTGDGDRSIVMNVAASEEAVLSQEKELRRQAQLASPQTVHHQDPNRLEMAGSRSRGEDQQSMANVRPNHSPSGTIQSNMRGEANLAGTRHGMKDSMLSEELSRESKQPEHHTQLAPSPWGDAKTTPRKSLADIQREESERLQEERMEAEYKRSLEAAAAGSNGPWHMESDHPMKETPWSVEDQKQTRKASLLEIQAEEGKRKEEEKKRLAEKKDQELAAMGSQLKMMLGVGGTVAAQQGGGQEKTKLNTGSAWGVKAAPSQRKKSLLEIQAEEEKRARQQATAAASKGGGMWASLAAGRPAPMTMAQKVKRPEERNVANPWGVRQPAVNRPSAQVGSIGGPNSDNQRSLPAGEDELFWEVQPENRNESSGATENGHSQRMRNGNAISTSEDSSVAAQTKDREVTEARDRSEVFSGIPASMKPWCTERIRKLTGNDDLTLVQFCMSLEDASEIREYLAQYLGSTPEVSAFATEFINRKNAIRKDSSSTSGGPLSSAMSSASSSSTAAGAAASSSTKKSKRKKKGQRIDNSLLGITAQIPPTAEDHY